MCVLFHFMPTVPFKCKNTGPLSFWSVWHSADEPVSLDKTARQLILTVFPNQHTAAESSDSRDALFSMRAPSQ